MVLALGVAMLLNQPLRGRSLLRTIYFLPVVTSTVAASVVWTSLFQPRYGLLSQLFEPFGLGETKWLVEPGLVLIPIAVVAIWQRVGFDMVIFLAGLQAIPGELYEAAIIDGANRWQRFRHVTLPMLSPTTFLILILAIISAFQIFDQVYVITLRTVPGGVGGSATTLTYFLYRTRFHQFRVRLCVGGGAGAVRDYPGGHRRSARHAALLGVLRSGRRVIDHADRRTAPTAVCPCRSG